MFVIDGTANTIVDLRTTLTSVQGNNPRSISFMIQTTYTRGCSMIATTGSNVIYQVFGIGFSCGGGVANIIQVFSNNADYIPLSGKVINDGLWHTVLVTYDGTTVSIIVDGRLDNIATVWNWGSGSASTITSKLNTVGNSGNYLGIWVDGYSYKWIGQLKNVQFYDYVITNQFALANSYHKAGSIIYNSGYFVLVAKILIFCFCFM